MNTSTLPRTIEVQKNGQAWLTCSQEDLNAWKANQAKVQKAKGYDKPVSDEEALNILGLL
jgi:hypothetical protein